MLDTHGRKYAQPFIEKSASLLLSIGLTPNVVTIISFIMGLSSGIFVLMGLPIVSVILLWLSGYLDAVDGSMARLKMSSSAWGTLMDITFDRIVEFAVIYALAMKFPEARLALLLLLGTILISITIFLTVGAVAKNIGIKSFYYQAGLAERSEGFIFLSLMMIFKGWLTFITLLFAAAIFITIIQRLYEAHKIFNKN